LASKTVVPIPPLTAISPFAWVMKGEIQLMPVGFPTSVKKWPSQSSFRTNIASNLHQGRYREEMRRRPMVAVIVEAHFGWKRTIAPQEICVPGRYNA
jgi:hypothetical protein